MDLIKILPEYLDVGLEDGELENLVEVTIRDHLAQLKRAIAHAVVSGRSFAQMDNLDRSQKSLEEARKFQEQYHQFTAELARLHDSKPAVGVQSETNHVGVPGA